MQRLTLATAGAVVLAACILGFKPAEDHSQALAKRHTARIQADTSSANSFAEGDPRWGKRHAAPPSETSDRFQAQARQIASMPQDTDRENTVRDLAQEWAKDDPAAAERWARTLDDPSERERALTHICLEVAAWDPREAIGIARRHQLHEGTVEAIAAKWANADFEAASSWADDLPHGEMLDRVLMRLVQSRAGEAPAEAAALLSESPLTGKLQDEAAMAVLHQWLLKDPEAARQWVELFPEGPLKERATVEFQRISAHR